MSSSREDWFLRYHTRKCDTCQLSLGTLYYQTDLAYPCSLCDECIHSAELKQQGSFHQQVLIAPSSTMCYGSSATDFNEIMVHKGDEEIGKDEIAPWLSLDLDLDLDNQLYLDSEFVEFMKQEEHSTCSEYTYYNQNPPFEFHHGINGCDSVVSFQNMKVNDQQEQKNQEFYAALENDQPKGAQICTMSSNPNFPAFFLDNGLVPKTTMSNISHKSYVRPQEEIIHTMTQLQITRMNRQAKVLRYKEKKKVRKFDKRIRYASRKASADIRARVNGKFVKIPEVEKEQQIFSTGELGYGIVPSFNFNQELNK